MSNSISRVGVYTDATPLVACLIIKFGYGVHLPWFVWLIVIVIAL